MEVICDKIERNSFDKNEKEIDKEVTEKIASIATSCKTATELNNKLNHYKGSFTRGLNHAQRKGFDQRPSPDAIDANYRSSLLSARIGLERPYRVICGIIDLINENGNSEAIEIAQTEYTKIEKNYEGTTLRANL